MALRTRRIVREGLWVGAGQAAVALASLSGVRILTTLMSPGDYGQLTLLLGLSLLGFGLFVLPFNQATMRYFPVTAVAGDTALLRGTAARYTRRGALAGMGLILSGGIAWWGFASAPPGPASFVLASAVLAADSIRAFESGLLNAARRHEDYALRNALDAWSRPLLATVAILAFGSSAENVLIGYAAGSFLVSLALKKRTVRPDAASHGEGPGCGSIGRDLTAYALPLVPIAVLNWTMSLSDRYILAGFGGAAIVGVYAAAYGLGSQPFVAANAFIHTVLRPILYDAVARGDRQKERITLLAFSAAVSFVSGVGVALFSLFATGIAGLLLGADFRPAAALLPWIAAAYALQNVQQIFEVYLYAHACTRRIVLVQVIAAAVSLLLYLLLIPRYGAFGAALGTLATFGVTCATAAGLAISFHRRLRGA